MKKKVLAMLLVATCVLQFAGCAPKKEADVYELPKQEEDEKDDSQVDVEVNDASAAPIVADWESVDSIKSNVLDGGNLYSEGDISIEVSPEELLEHFDYGDIVLVSLGERGAVLATVANGPEGNQGDFVLSATPGLSCVELFSVGKCSAVELGIMNEEERETGTHYELNEGITLPLPVYIYADDVDTMDNQSLVRHLQDSISNNRDDYPGLSDEDFANFRAVSAPGLKQNWIYRSTSAVRGELGRNDYVIKLAEDAGVKTFINLSDDEERAKSEAGYAGYYGNSTVIYSPMDSHRFEDPDRFDRQMGNAFRAYAQNDGPFLFHCKGGKDRTGFMAAVLEALAGASVEEIRVDYARTYINLYGVMDGNKQVELSPAVKDCVADYIVILLEEAFETDDLINTDLQNAAEQYLMNKAGMTYEEVNALKESIME